MVGGTEKGGSAPVGEGVEKLLSTLDLGEKGDTPIVTQEFRDLKLEWEKVWDIQSRTPLQAAPPAPEPAPAPEPTPEPALAPSPPAPAPPAPSPPAPAPPPPPPPPVSLDTDRTPYYLPAQKRQKINHYPDIDINSLLTPLAVSLDKADDERFLRLFSTRVAQSPSGYLQRVIENAFGFTSLDHGSHLQGWHFSSAYGLPDLFTCTDPQQYTNVSKLSPFAEDYPVLDTISARPAPRVFRSTSRLLDPLRYSYELHNIKQLNRSRSTKVGKAESKMATAGDSQLFDEHFTVTSFDQSKYDRVARIGGTSGNSETVMTLDINTEMYPLAVGETIHVVLANSLSLDGSKDGGKGWRDVSRNGPGGETTLADMFDYVCHGKIYKFEDGEDGNTIKVYVSFGGLLMALEGPYKKLTPLRVDYVYLLVKK